MNNDHSGDAPPRVIIQQQVHFAYLPQNQHRQEPQQQNQGRRLSEADIAEYKR